MSPSHLEVKGVQWILCFPAWGSRGWPFHLQRALLHQVRRQGPCSIKALLPQPSRAIPGPWALPAPLAVSTLLPCISLLPLQRARGCTPAEFLVLWQPQTLHKPAKGLILLCLSPPVGKELATQQIHVLVLESKGYNHNAQGFKGSTHLELVNLMLKLLPPKLSWKASITQKPIQASTRKNQFNKANEAVSNGKTEEGWGSKTLC